MLSINSNSPSQEPIIPSLEEKSEEKTDSINDSITAPLLINESKESNDFTNLTNNNSNSNHTTTNNNNFDPKQFNMKSLLNNSTSVLAFQQMTNSSEIPMTDRRILEIELKTCKSKLSTLEREIRKMKNKLEKLPITVTRKNKISRTNFSVRRKLVGHYGKVYSVYFSKKSEITLVSASQDGKIIIWDSNRENKKIAIPLRSSWVMTCCFSPSDIYVSSGGLDNIITIYNIPENTQGWEQNILAYNELKQHTGYISCIKFIDESHLISSSGDSTCLLWDITKNKSNSSYQDHEKDVMYISIYKKKSIFLSVSVDKTCKLWDIRMKGEKCIGNFSGHTQDVNTCDWLNDNSGNTFITGSDDSTIRLYDIRAYRQLSIYSRDDVTSGITSCIFSKSGKYIFSGYDDDPYMFSWDTIKNKITQDFTQGGSNNRLQHRVSSLSLNCNGKAFASGSWDNVIRIWS